MDSTRKFKEDPLIKLIQIGIELWIRSKCKSLKEITVEILGSTAALISGKISGAKVEAYKVDFKDLALNQVKLISGPINIKVNLFSKDNRIMIENAFSISGLISLNNENINKIITSESWIWIGDLLAKNLLEADHLAKIVIHDNFLEIHAFNIGINSVKVENFSLEVSSGTLKFSSRESTKDFLMPMDDSIKIETVMVKLNQIIATIRSTVKP